MMNVTLDGTEMAVLAILKQKPDSSREEVADMIINLSMICETK